MSARQVKRAGDAGNPGWHEILIERNTPKRRDVLREPIKIRLLRQEPLPSVEELQKQAEAQYQEQYDERVRAIFKRYGTRAPAILEALAVINSVEELRPPCFQIQIQEQKPGGRPPSRDEECLFSIWLRVMLIVERKGCSERNAVQILAKQRGERADTLRSQLAQAKKSTLVAMASPALKQYGVTRFCDDIYRTFEDKPQALAAFKAVADAKKAARKRLALR